MDIEPRNLNIVAIHGSRMPEMLGTFHLDDHNVQEWSDASQPGWKHRARKEVGKWVDPDKNADIKFQRREDSKQSEKSREQQRTEVIQGSAPDAAFQIVRSQRQFQDSDQHSGSRISSTMSTSYQMTTSHGVRSTSKTTSNKTTTKTVTVSGGRSDDFENLKMSFQPLDTSTQRERINVSRSGTMGVRRPPTRRHTPAALLSSSPDELQGEAMDVTLEQDSDESMGISDYARNVDPAGISIVGYKNISPKIRVGFPVEIQLELQSKLRYSNGENENVQEPEDDFIVELDHHENIDSDSAKIRPASPNTLLNNNIFASSLKSSAPQSTGTGSTSYRSKLQQQESMKTTEAEHTSELIDANESADSLFQPLSKSNDNEDLTFDFGQRRKSYGFESFEEPANLPEEPSISEDTFLPRHISNSNTSSTSNIYARANDFNSFHDRPVSNLRLSPSSLSRSWDLIQSVASAQQKREANKKLFSSSSNLDDLSYVPTKSPSNHKTPQKSVVMLKPFEENDGDDLDIPEPLPNRKSRDYTLDSLELFPELKKLSSVNSRRSATTLVNIDRSQLVSPPDVIHHNLEKDPPVPEKSKELMKMLDETPDLLNKMSFKNYFPPSNSDLLEIQPLRTQDNNLSTSDDDFQSNLSYLNESLSRILTERDDLKFSNSHNADTSSPKKNQHASSNYLYGKSESRSVKKTLRGDQLLANSYDDEERATDNISKGSKQTQVSHTWISSSDQKPSQHARDNNVTTSISATHDPFKRAQKKVEFCKTEVHFTPDSGKFNIVESDENKPSTVHLFRRKKKEKKNVTTNSVSTITSSETKKSTEISEKHDKLLQDSEQERKLHNQSHHKTYAMSSAIDDEDIDGLELVKKSAMVDVVGVDRNKNSLFDRWTEQDAKPELGVDEEIVTPTTTTANISSLNNNHDARDRLLEINTYDEGNILGSNESLLPSKLRKDKLLSDDFGELIPTKTVTKGSSHMPSHNNHILNNLNNKSTLMTEILGELGDDGDEGEDLRSDMILYNYGELKIQRFLKQLKSPSSHAGSESPIDILDVDPDQQVDDDESLNHFRFDNVYENGSFVPLATRRSLIEMNNRNRKRGSSSCHLSDNSSTASNYSLPHSDRESMSKGDYQLPLNATIDTKGEKPQITTVDLSYPFSTNNSYFSDPVKRNFKIPKTEHDSHDDDPLYDVIVPPVKAEVRSLPPFNKHGRVPISSNQSNLYSSPSPTGESNTFKHSKPPEPILPSRFSSFEKSGAALRERFNAKNSTTKSSKFGNFLDKPRSKPSKPRISNDLYSDSEANYLPSKSIVTIGGDDDLSVNKNTNKINLDSDNLTVSHDAPLPGSHYNASELKHSEMTSPEPILSMDHTWKGPAHFDSQSKDRGAPVMRSMTFPKSSRPEPEWVAKAKSRESRVTDWNLVGKQCEPATPRKSEPPWITEIRFKSKPPLPEETKSLPKTPNVYPWHRDSKTETEIPVRIQSPTENTPYNSGIDSELNGSVTIEELHDDISDVAEFPNKPDNSLLKEYAALNRRNPDPGTDSTPSVIKSNQILSKEERHLSKELSSNETHSDNYISKHKNADYYSASDISDTSLDRKLMAPLTESTKRSRKPLQSLSPTNKNNSNKNTQNGKPSAPPRPPKPPQRISSLGSKSQPLSVSSTEKKSSHQKHHSHKQSSNSSMDDTLLTSRSNTPVHTHPLVKVAKIPSAKSMVSKSPSPAEGKGTVSKNKAKHHVVTSETKLTCKSKLVDGPKERETESQNTSGSSQRPLPKLPAPRTATIASPHRKR
ncbi:unnamed protein product [Allacma fusca]|uniref:Uncharacterized protein n=1 Tax=Allacma fusca TaxID=39272 RepID=A0A8J2MFK6_9HEXA|nr:unnamed protein product [Allacma fusca]